MIPRRWLHRLALVVLVSIWGTTWAAIRVGLDGIPPFTGVALRFSLAGALLLLLVPVLGVRFRWDRRELGLWALNGLFSFTLSYGIVYWAEQWVPSGLVSVLWATFPLWVALLAHPFLPGERLTVRQSLGVLLGFGGVVVIFSEDLSRLAVEPAVVESAAAGPGAGPGWAGPGLAVAAAVVLLSPLVSAVANVAVKRWGEGIHPLSLTAVPMLGTGLVMGVVAWTTEDLSTVRFDALTVGSVLYLAVFGSAVTFTLYFWLLSRLPATRLSLITYAIPVVAVIVGTVALDEPITLRIGLGAALVVAGVAVAVRRGR